MDDKKLKKIRTDLQLSLAKSNKSLYNYTKDKRFLTAFIEHMLNIFRIRNKKNKNNV